jgi:hypothetical protein
VWELAGDRLGVLRAGFGKVGEGCWFRVGAGVATEAWEQSCFDGEEEDKCVSWVAAMVRSCVLHVFTDS